MDSPPRILLVEDDEGDAELARRELKNAGAGPVEWARSLDEARDRLERGGFDVVLTDLKLPGTDGLDTVRRLRAWTGKLPVVVLTGAREEKLGRKALREGAQDYLLKEDLRGPWLARALEYAVERRRLESLKEEVLRDVSHELQTPISAAYAFLSAILDGQAGPLDPGLRRYVEVAFRNMTHLSRLVDDLVEAARAREGRLSVEPRRTSLCRAAAEAAEDMRPAFETAGLLLETRCTSELPAVLADPKRCRQVMLNLLSNALKFTPKGGRVSVDAAYEPGPPAFLRVTVSDTGVGMEPARLAALFQGAPAERRPVHGRRGLGVGLAICRELLRAQGGSLAAESRPGKGSAFSFTVPAFSMEALLKPLQDAGAASFSLLELSVPPSDTAPLARHAAVLAAEAALKETLPAGSLVLPGLGEALDDGRVFSAVTAVLDAGALANRLTELPELKDEGLVPSGRALGAPIALGAGAEALTRAARETLARAEAALKEAA